MAAPAAATSVASSMESRGESEIEVHFDKGSANVDSDSRASLEEVAEYLKANPNKRIEIQGHTDSTGTSQVNADVSNARANAVKQYLENEYGIEPSRLNARGYGESFPISDNATAEGRAENRRVMILSI